MINNGMFPSLNNETDSDFYFLEFLEGINEKIVSLIKEEIPQKFKIDSKDIQVLCPSIKGSCGVRSLNETLQKELNPNYEKGIAKFGSLFAVNDKVLQTENNYDLDVYNGDIGVIKSIDEEMQEAIVSFDEKEVVYDFSDLDQLTLAYATTIHKSQGSEYKAVVIPITMQSYIMLKRNLIYTAVTRGKKLVIIIGEKKALYMGIKNINTSKRYSTLKDWLIYGNERKDWETN
jgi:exodeoxyribonuclease V alpha subunit